MPTPIKPPFSLCVRGDALAAPLHDAPGALALTLHDRFGDPCGVVVRGGPTEGPVWLLSAPGDPSWDRWERETNVWHELDYGAPGRVRIVSFNEAPRVLEGAIAIECYGASGQLDALAHRVLSADTWAFVSCADEDWVYALSSFGYIGGI